VTLSTDFVDNQVCLEVSDTGMGIDPDDLPHIHGRFFRGKNARNSGVIGTGIGLAIVHEIVRLHHGEMDVHSQAGQGSRFIVRLTEYKG
jgi:signal transduction histidine kinase